MEYTVLARRYRPQSFGDVVGQQHISQALLNAIGSDRVAHAYLFTGARGVGKTSTARILAKALNCPNVQDGQPCNTCEACQSISVGGDMDVLEIDGASNRSIDDIRSLRSNVNVRSMRSRYKIYIIDEVHMLTKEAFNALLKTLEEPPPNVKFIFCTTEPHKLPDTILSRCQRFDFGTIATGSIKDRLRDIAATEGIAVDDDAIDLVARRAAGSMRDSQSLFDQLLSFGGKNVTAADVHRLVGTAPDDRLYGLLAAVVAGDAALVLDRLNDTLAAGVQLGEFVDQLIAGVRDLMVVSAGAGQLDLMSMEESQRPAVLELAKQWGLSPALAALQVLSEAKSRMRTTTQGRPLVELALVRISQLRQLEVVGQLVEALKKNAALPITVNLIGGATGGTLSAAQRVITPPQEAPAPADPPQEALRSAEKKTPAVTAPARVDVPEEPVFESPGPESTSVEPVPASEPSKPKTVWGPGNEREIWPQLLAELPDMARSVALTAGKVVIGGANSGPNGLALHFSRRYNMSKTSLERSGDLQRIQEAAIRLAGRPVSVTCLIDPTLDPAPSQGAEPVAETRAGNEVTVSDPFVAKAMEIFGAKWLRADPVVLRTSNSMTSEEV
jgi:DNA polymerase III subunit gamma/tau